jgi:diguanylate cyclase (GGDEF)-like protein
MKDIEKIKDISQIKGICDAIGDGISIQNTDLIVIYQNQAHKDIIGDHAGEYCYKGYEQKEKPCEGCPLVKSFNDGKVNIAERTAPTENGTLHVEITASPLKDSTGKIIAVIEIVRDVTERKKAEEAMKENEKKLQTLSITDELTGLYNRRGFFTLAEQQLKQSIRDNKGIYLVIADVDHLKNVNDNLGHHEGDVVLIKSANILRDSFREADIIARIGGDEFVVLVNETPETTSDSITFRLKDNIAEKKQKL